MAELGVEGIPAYAPQAKGRVERLFGTLQDRLVTELRLAGVTTREAANQFLPGYLPGDNRRFGVRARHPLEVHRPAPAAAVLPRGVVPPPATHPPARPHDATGGADVPA